MIDTKKQHQTIVTMSRGPYMPLSEAIKIAAIAILRNRGRMRTSDLHKEIAANVASYGHNPQEGARAIYERTYEIRGRYPPLPRSYARSLETMIAAVVDELVESRRVRRFFGTEEYFAAGANLTGVLYYHFPTSMVEMDVLDRVVSVL
jgi:hypothetical protein